MSSVHSQFLSVHTVRLNPYAFIICSSQQTARPFLAQHFLVYFYAFPNPFLILASKIFLPTSDRQQKNDVPRSFLRIVIYLFLYPILSSPHGPRHLEDILGRCQARLNLGRHQTRHFVQISPHIQECLTYHSISTRHWVGIHPEASFLIAA
jgi:hypothetical protein